MSFTGRALDLSVHGLLLECRHPLEVGEDLRFSFVMPGGEGGVRGAGTVVRAASARLFGVERPTSRGTAGCGSSAMWRGGRAD